MRNIIMLSVAALVFYGCLGTLLGRSAHGSLPSGYARQLPEAAKGWEVIFSTPEGPSGAFGPISLRVPFERPVLDALGTPDPLWKSDAYEMGRKSFEQAYYGFGTVIEGLWSNKQETFIAQVTLGNPNAMSAEDPLVKACPFKLPGGIAFGMAPNEVNRRLNEIMAPAERALYAQDKARRKYSTYYRRIGGLTEEKTFGSVHYMNGQLVAVVLL